MKKSPFKRIASALIAAALVLSACAAVAQQPQGRLTLGDLIALNGGDLVYTTNDDGFITFLRGRYCDYPLKDEAEAARALEGISLLLGADDDVGLKFDYRVRDDNNYMFYMFSQWCGDMAVDDAVVKLVADPDGNPVAVSSSVIAGVPANVDNYIAPEKALEIVKAELAGSDPDTAYSFYEDKIDKALAQLIEDDNAHMLFAYAVYTDNPKASVARNDLPYLAHYVSAMGKYLYSMPISDISSRYAIMGNDAQRAFEGMKPAIYAGTVTTSAGEKREVSVPVMLDEKTGTYYLGDVSRKMLAADFWEFNYNDWNVVPLSSKDNADWDDAALIGYENYIRAYDFYNSVGWASTDGLGTPILLLTNYVNEKRESVNNASFMGNLKGWQTFAMTSVLNNYNEALDVIGHEYTHGVTTATMTKILYENQYGAINESMSDIMGNIMEMLLGQTDDTRWLIGEQSGDVIRSMTDPNSLAQPAFVGDIYYVPDAEQPGDPNDRGGVHVNNSLLSVYAEDDSFESVRYYFTGAGWSPDEDDLRPIEVAPGETVELPDMKLEEKA